MDGSPPFRAWSDENEEDDAREFAAFSIAGPDCFKRGSLLIDGRCAQRRAPMARGLLVGIGEFDQLWLTPCPPE